jgi:hypothetical protein
MVWSAHIKMERMRSIDHTSRGSQI